MQCWDRFILWLMNPKIPESENSIIRDLLFIDQTPLEG